MFEKTKTGLSLMFWTYVLTQVARGFASIGRAIVEARKNRHLAV